MNIAIQPFTIEHIPEVKAFNRRMLDGGLKPDLVFPETPFLEFPTRGEPIWQEPFLAVEGEEVRGGYYFTHERYAVAGEVRWIANYRHPISEVVVNKAYRGLSSKLLADARSRQPLLYSVGFGGERNPNLLRLRREGWTDIRIPFWFRVVRPSRFFSQLAFFRKTGPRRVVFDIAARTGLGWLGIKAAQGLRSMGGGGLGGYTVETTPDFGPWADELWEANRTRYLLIAVRDRAALNLRYPPEKPRFTRLKILSGGRAAGWAVLLDKRMQNNPYFGGMHVGTLVDCLAAPEHERAVVAAAVAQLEAAGVDILVSNQASASWGNALRINGFLSGPSNYHLAFSAELTGMLSPLERNAPRFHVNRGDGAGISRL